LSGIRSLVNYDLALTVSVRDLAGEYAKQCPIQTCKRRIVKMPFDDGADVGELTITMCRGLVELTAAAHGTIAVIIRFALKYPLIRHLNAPSLTRYSVRLYRLDMLLIIA
jgi:hypothetical protein